MRTKKIIVVQVSYCRLCRGDEFYDPFYANRFNLCMRGIVNSQKYEVIIESFPFEVTFLKSFIFKNLTARLCDSNVQHIQVFDKKYNNYDCYISQDFWERKDLEYESDWIIRAAQDFGRIPF